MEDLTPIAACEEGLSEDAVKVLRLMLLLMPLRKLMPDTSDRDYLAACYNLIDNGYAELQQLPNQDIRFRLTPVGEDLFGKVLTH